MSEGQESAPKVQDEEFSLSDRFVQLRFVDITTSTVIEYAIMPIFGPDQWTGVALRQPVEERKSILSKEHSTVDEAILGALRLLMEQENFAESVKLVPATQFTDQEEPQE